MNILIYSCTWEMAQLWISIIFETHFILIWKYFEDCTQGSFKYYISHRGGRGVSKCLIFSDKVGGRVYKFLIFSDKGGSGLTQFFNFFLTRGAKSKRTCETVKKTYCFFFWRWHIFNLIFVLNFLLLPFLYFTHDNSFSKFTLTSWKVGFTKLIGVWQNMVSDKGREGSYHFCKDPPRRPDVHYRSTV